MGSTTAIEWTDHTFNPWRGCAKVHAGCTHCYAEKNVGVKMNAITWGEAWQGGQRVISADSTWKHPMTWARAAAREGVRRRVFCASLADVLEVPEMPPLQRLTTAARDRVNLVRRDLDAARARLWDIIRQTATVLPDGTQGSPETGIEGYAGLDWLLLTKRPENWEMVPEDVRPFVWLGTSISDQKTADEWVPRLLRATGFRYRFLSLEPLVGPVNLGLMGTVPSDISPSYRPVGSMIDWVILGGESGRWARVCNVAWHRQVGRECADAGVPLFRKQLGARPVEERVLRCTTHAPRTELLPMEGILDPKGGDIAEWPQDLRVRDFPGVR